MPSEPDPPMLPLRHIPALSLSIPIPSSPRSPPTLPEIPERRIFLTRSSVRTYLRQTRTLPRIRRVPSFATPAMPCPREPVWPLAVRADDLPGAVHLEAAAQEEEVPAEVPLAAVPEDPHEDLRDDLREAAPEVPARVRADTATLRPLRGTTATFSILRAFRELLPTWIRAYPTRLLKRPTRRNPKNSPFPTRTTSSASTRRSPRTTTARSTPSSCCIWIPPNPSPRP